MIVPHVDLFSFEPVFAHHVEHPCLDADKEGRENQIHANPP